MFEANKPKPVALTAITSSGPNMHNAWHASDLAETEITVAKVLLRFYTCWVSLIIIPGML